MGCDSTDADIRSRDVKTQASSVDVECVCAKPDVKMKQIAVENGYFHGKNDRTYRYFYSKVGTKIQCLMWCLGTFSG